MPVVFPNGKTIWGNGSPENEEWENALSSLIEEGGLILDVGCGKFKVHDSVMGVDPYAESDLINVKAYMWDMPFEDNSIDAIVCFHALEHISKYQVMPTLAEFSRVLKPNGKLLILVPDLEYVLWSFLANPNPNWEMDMIFGLQSHEGEFHRTGYTKKILTDYLNEIGTLKIEKWFKVSAYMQYNIGLLATKLRSDD